MDVGENKDWPSIKDHTEPKKVDVKYDTHMKIMAPKKPVREALNFTEFCEYLDNKEPDITYKVEGKLPQCPPGYIWSRKRKDCIPKTEKDKVSGRLDDKDNHNSGATYNVWGRTGVNGDGYAYEDAPGTDANAIHSESWSYSFENDAQ